LIVALPESLNFLIAQGTRGKEIARILAKVTPETHYAPDSRFFMAQAYESKLQLPELFRQGYASRTVLLWLAFFCSLITLFFLGNWTPTLLNSMSIGPKQIVTISAVAQAAGLIGSIVAARLIVLYPPFRVASIGYAVAAGLLVLLGLYGSGYAAFLAVNAFAYFFLIGTQNIANAMSGHIYPPRTRATGSGWAIGIGRMGGVIGPSLAGVLLAWHWRTGRLLAAASLPLLVAGAAAFLLSRVVSNQRSALSSQPEGQARASSAKS
jgi:AAHS family 4-hydroxybenzoate transporter-like MFS transporter